MHVVGHNLQLLQAPLIHLYAIVKKPFDPGGYFALEDAAAILGCPDQMILQSMSAMGTMEILFAHVSTACRKGSDSAIPSQDCAGPPSESFTSGLKAGVL